MRNNIRFLKEITAVKEKLLLQFFNFSYILNIARELRFDILGRVWYNIMNIMG